MGSTDNFFKTFVIVKKSNEISNDWLPVKKGKNISRF